ncbi:major facilitator superfamily domain-containing protein [Rhypophila decipiens]|uniref:Major facilitator superfamily domain-containing protein n=1 Tax=Rhypophila decipiens TaxID=261697 RepID=A0AAN6Y2X4_9PEZI|nr:major facilitator superfamily domain-containing protein [Rhypophila decipiens]
MPFTTMPGWKYAFSLSSESVKAATPPGTVRLIEQAQTTLHHGRYVEKVVRFPVPTSDPADPLNWAPWRKISCLLTVSLYSFACNFSSASLSPALPIWNLWFPENARPFKDLMKFVAVNVLCIGMGNILWVPLANVFGRRPVLILSSMILFLATLLAGFTADFQLVLVCRVFQGLGSSVSETIAPAIVGDMFFIHERAGWMALFTACLASGSVIGGISGGYIAVHLGWFYIFHIGAALTGTAFLCTVFFAPETLFERESPCLPAPRVPRNVRYWTHQHSRRIPARPPCLSLGTLPSMHMTLPSRFLGSMVAAPGPVVDPGRDLFLTWYETSSSEGDLSTVSTPPRLSKQHPPPPPIHDNTNNQATTTNFSLPVGYRPAGAAGGSNGNENRHGILRSSRRMSTITSSHPLPLQLQPPQPPPAELSYLSSLKIGMYRGSFLYQFAKPWMTLRLPTTWIVMLQYGGLVGSVAVISTVGPQILSAPPYQWGANAGLLYIGALTGIVLGCLYSSVLADWRLKRGAKRQDHGFAEPESRIPIMLPSLAIATSGLLVFGFCAEYGALAERKALKDGTAEGMKIHLWVGLEVGYGMITFALTQVPSIWFSYLIDSYAQLASDCFVMTCILRGIIPFAWTFFVDQWIQKDGYLIPFGGFTVIMGVFSLLIVPLIWFGKRMRIATARYVVGNQYQKL